MFAQISSFIKKELFSPVSRFYYFLLIGIFLSITQQAKSQMYGLGFYSHEVTKDLRTGLNLTEKRSLAFVDEFELSFDFGLIPNSVGYFGYIFRIITDNNLNIDLLFNFNRNATTNLSLVAGQRLLMKMPTDFDALCSGWARYKVKINPTNDQLSFCTPDTILTFDNLGFNKDEKFRIIFGASDIRNFKNIDVPAMNIRDIRISQKGKVKHYWPLNEIEGFSVSDKVGKEDAIVHNPLWMMIKHVNWENIYQAELLGVAQIAFNPENESIILIGEDKILRFNVASSLATEIIPKSKDNNLLQGRQAFYDVKRHLLYSYDIDFSTSAIMNPDSLDWRQKNVKRDVDWTIFLHHNKYLSTTENSLYIFGGYGQHEYKNTVQKFDLGTNHIEQVNVTGDKFYPRYLSASGALDDTVYILGGYGSSYGAQILNPRTYNDLMAFSMKDHKFLKKFDLKTQFDDMAYANSMIFDPRERTYYALIFPILKYESYLQLVKGSLDKPDISFVGNTIPYLFNDTRSFSDLFYCERGRKLVAATILTENNKSQIRLYSLNFPPSRQVTKSLVKKVSGSATAIIVVIGFVVVIGAVILLIRKKLSGGKTSKSNERSFQQNESFSEDISKNAEHYSIIFFGDFKVYDKSGVDITKKFTKLLKELFLLLWLHSLKNDTGISTEKIIEILWYNYTETSAHNNKAVNISKLRNLLHEVGNCELSNKTGYWKIIFDSHILKNDYSDFLQIVKVKNELSKEQIQMLIRIIQNGTFLSNLSYGWLDEFKAGVANDAIDGLIQYSSHIDLHKEADLINQIADSILKFDSVNEEAMIMKCRALIILGRHTIANDTFNRFAREYKILYGTDFEKSFNEISGL